MPAALLGERMWDASKSKKAYPTRDDFVRACVPILRKELELLRDAGATIVQIDDPHLCLFVDPEVRAGYENADKAADFAVDMVNEVVDGFSDLKLAVHLCRRAGRCQVRVANISASWKAATIRSRRATQSC